MFVAQAGRGLCTTELQGSTWRSRWRKGEEIKRQAKNKVISVCRELTNENKQRDIGEHVWDKKD